MADLRGGRYGGIKCYWTMNDVGLEAHALPWRRMEITPVVLVPATPLQRVWDWVCDEIGALWGRFVGLPLGGAE